MAELTAKKRNSLSKSTFGMPGSRKYPMPDREHAINAKARARQMLNAGKLSQSSYEHIVTMANHKIAEYSSN